MEPVNLRRWRIGLPPNGTGHFFTCGRPGRSNGKEGRVSDDLVSAWISRLPGPKTAIISLLGRKQTQEGLSEFSYYSFCGGFDTPSECRNLPTFQEWLDQRHMGLQILVREHPTIDAGPIPYERLRAIEMDIYDLLLQGRSVVVVDSGGADRTGRVCKHMGAIRIPFKDSRP